MKFAITGASGLIGSRLVESFTQSGHQVLSVGRHFLYGDAGRLAEVLEGSDIIIHLAGAPLFSRWNKAGRQRILDSRVLPTQNLSRAVKLMKTKPRLFISTSAVGIYSGRERQTESDAEYGHDFPAAVCKQWEAAALGIKEDCRLVIFRLGVVLDARGGALKRMLPAFRMGFGGPVASGKQCLSWVHIGDIQEAMIFAIHHPLQGVFNLCAPETVTNNAFSRQLARVLHRPCWFRIPAFLLRLLFGRSADVLINGQEVLPENLLKAGFVFRFPGIRGALQDLFGPPSTATFRRSSGSSGS